MRRNGSRSSDIFSSTLPGVDHILGIYQGVAEAFLLTSLFLTSSTNYSFLVKENSRVEFVKAYTIHNKNHINTAINIVNIILITIIIKH